MTVIFDHQYHGFEDWADAYRDVFECVDKEMNPPAAVIPNGEWQGALRVVVTYTAPPTSEPQPAAHSLAWDDLPRTVRDEMAWLGNYRPTTTAADKQVKGYRIDEDGEGHKSYLNPKDLRELAEACIVVAIWLEGRANTPAAGGNDHG